MDKMVKKEIKSALSFAKQTVKFVFFLAHLLFQTKGNLKNPLKKVYSGKVAMLANGPSMKNVLPRLTTDEFKNTDFIYNPQIQISAESETKRSIFREKDKTKRSKKESAQHSKSRNKSFVMTSVSAL